MNFILPTRIITGKNCVINNKALFSAIGKKPLIVTGKSSAKKCGALADVLTAVDGEYAIFDGVRQNPTTASCYEAADIARKNGCDCIIGIGGGSPLDAAKAVAVLAANPDINEATLFTNQWKNKPLPIICVGTTAGTGSEVTPVAVLTTDQGRKKSIRADAVFPAASFGDYRYTLGLSEEFVKSTAVDAVAHCIESYFNRKADELSREFALRGLELMLPELKKLTGSLGDVSVKGRENMYLASIYGGLAISVTGTALCHAMGYFLTEQYGLPHGVACAVYLGDFTSLSAKADKAGAKRLFKRLGCDIKELTALINTLVGDVGVIMSEQEAQELEDRWDNNKSLEKSVFEISPAQATSLIKKLFCR